MNAKITADEWLAELDRINALTTPDGFTTAELSDELGVSTKLAREKLRQGIGAGVIECVGRVPRNRIDGQRSLVPAYRRKTTKEA